MDELIKQIIMQAPCVGILIFLHVRAQAQNDKLTQTLIEIVKLTKKED